MPNRPTLLIALLLCLACAGAEPAALPAKLGYHFAFELRAKPNAAGEAWLYFSARDRSNTYALHATPKQIALVKFAAGKPLPLGKPRPWHWAAKNDVVIQRRLGRLAVFVNGRLAAAAADKAYSGRKAAFAAKGPAFAGKLVRVQPLGQITFNDDFMRAEASGEWQPACGRWEVSAMRAAQRSANPFSLFARFPASQIFRPLYHGRTRRFVGLGMRVRYAPSGLQVTAVYPDTPAERADVREGDLVSAIDGRPVQQFSRREILTKLMQPHDGKRHVVRVAGPREGKWIERDLALMPAPVDLDRIDKDVVLPGSKLGLEAIALAGYPFWSDLAFEVSAKSTGRGAMGVVFAWRGPGDHWRVEWTGAAASAPAPANVLRLVRVAGGKAKVVASKPIGFAEQTFYRLRTLVALDRISVEIDGNPVLAYKLPAGQGVSPGRIGLYARDSNGVYFDDVRVRSIEMADEPPPLDRLVEVFENDAMMRKWAGNPAWEWLAYAGGEFWRKFPTVGDARVTVSPIPGDRLFQIIAAAEQRRPETGYALTCDPKAGTVELARLGKVVAKGKLPKGCKTVALDCRSNHIAALADGKPVLGFDDKSRLTGCEIGLAGVPEAQARRARVDSPTVADYFFRRAPVDWRVVSGIWGTMNRWVCEPSWSWLGGRHPAMAAIMHKGSFFGDVAVDVYCGPMMIAYQGSIHERFRDLCVTMCSKTGALFDGYTVVFGGGNNTWTRLYRNGKVVGETKDRQFLLPAGYSRDEFDAHRDWFHISLRKRAGKVQLRLYDELALEYNDPNPLPGGRVVVWTCKNGMLVSRARITASQVKPKAIEPSRLAYFEDAALSNVVAGEAQVAIKKSGGQYVVTNTVSGSHFAVRLKPDKVDLRQRPVLRFGFRAVKGQPKVDLYFDYRGVPHRVRLTGPREAEGIVALAAFEKRPADKAGWQALACGLFEHMRARYPRAKQLVVENLRIGSYYNEDYLFAGLSGNHMGDAYALRQIEWAKRDAPAPLRVRKVELPFDDPKNQSLVTFRLNGRWSTFNADGIQVRVAALGAQPRTFTLSDPALYYVPGKHAVVLDLETARLSFPQQVAIGLSIGRAGKKPDYTAKWNFDAAKDKVPPVVRILGSKRRKPITVDFEQDAAGIYSVGETNFVAGADAGGAFFRDDATAAAGRYSLRVANKKLGIDFGIGWMRDGFSLARYPLLSFYYAVPRTTRGMSVAIGVKQQAEAISFARADGKWRRCDANLLALLRSRLPSSEEPRAESIWIGDTPWYSSASNYEGAAFHLDNLRLTPVLSAADLKFDWYVWDISGVPKTRTACNNSGDVTSEAPLRDGLAYFCVQAQDARGNASPVERFAFPYDGSAPQVLDVNQQGPDEQGRLVQFFELNGVDPASVKLRVNGKLYRIDGAELWYDAVSGWLHFKPRGGVRLPMEVKLESLADYAGNAAPPQQWTFAAAPPAAAAP